MTQERQAIILVIEDDDYCRDLLDQILTMNGYIVKVAHNGLEGLDMLHRVRPDLILLDMKMPVMNGWEFSRRLRLEKNNTVPFVIVSAAEDIQTRAQETGANGWLEKPFELESLLTIVESHLKKALNGNDGTRE
ncbi:MAG TPA: response regulator [Oligoflexus sp.]|uniref:response regulator n=1 Tax=Oligoflexus sp. TaxID=1971216 RepID=UPI002D2F4311|nr:response regulator [Oligoflexus sp.]HYX36714.1 response regulator [Oligoflexus sp.]